MIIIVIINIITLAGRREGLDLGGAPPTTRTIRQSFSFLLPTDFWFHVAKSYYFLRRFFTFLFSTLCGPVDCSAGARGFVLLIS